MLNKFLEHFFKKHPDIKDQDSYAVAVSGGPDSMALLHAFHLWALDNNKVIHVLTVDHGLREESKEEASQVASWVAFQNSKNIKHSILTWQGDKPEVAVLEAARHARYNLMSEYCLEHKIETIFVAHHQDDQAETFLIRLSKGSGLDGLASMGEVYCYDDSVKIARPFLDVLKQDLMTYCENNSLEFVRDLSNENKNYLRPRLRQSMSILEEEGLSVKRLSTLARRLRRARHALEDISEASYDRCLKSKTDQAAILDFKRLRQETEEIAFRVLQKAVLDMRGGAEYSVRMDRLENLFESLWNEHENFKPRTLGGLLFALKGENSALYIEREHAEKE